MIALTTLTAGCEGLLGKARPKEKTAQQALVTDQGDTCEGGVPEYAQPLIVDLDAARRGDFEIAMREGVVVVGYDCNKLVLLESCRAEGGYGFMGYQPKEEVIRLADSTELSANLPISAGTIGAELGGEFSRGSTLDIALMMIGKNRTTRRATARDELIADRPGACDRATHFVRGATLGAFAMATGTKAETRGAAQIFGIPQLGKVGLKGGSKSLREVQRKDGELEACKGADLEGETPPRGCGALLRLELTVIDAARRQGPAAGDAPQPEVCGDGLVLTGGKCAAPAAEVPHLCKPKDYADCERQCARGEPGSCGRMGFYHEQGEHFPRSATKAAAFYRQACDADYAVGCASLGSLLVRGEGVARDVEAGVALVQKACDLGDPRYCAFLGGALYAGNLVPRDVDRAARLLRRACFGGSPDGCFGLGETYRAGVGGNPKDARQARALYQRGCDGQDPPSCMAYAIALEDGIGGPKDAAGGQQVFRSLCDGGFEPACREVKR